MNTFFTYLLIGSFALLCLIMGCSDTEDPSHSIDLTGKASGTLATEKMPLTTVPAAPTAPGAGIPFVKEVGYYRDWKLTKPIATAIKPGATLFTKVVFSEPMQFKPADDPSARPILYYRLNGKLIRFRIAKHGAGGKDFVSGDAKPFGGGTDDYICKYTVPTDATGEFGAAVGKFSADREGNTLAKFYTHTKKVTLGVDTVAPEVKEVGYYSDSQLTQPLSGTVKPGSTIFTKVVFSEPMRFKAADDNAARPILYYQLNSKQVRYRVSEHGASGQDFVSGDAKPLDDGTDAYLCKYIVPADATGAFGVAVGKFSADREGNTLAKFYTHSKKLKLGVAVAPPPVAEVPQEQTSAETAPIVLSVKHYLDDNETEEINADEVFVWAGTTLNTKIVFSRSVTPAVTYTTGNRTKAYTISKGVPGVSKGRGGVHWRGFCKPTDNSNTVWLCKQSVSVPSFSVTVTTGTKDMAGTHLKASVETVPIEVRPRPRPERVQKTVAPLGAQDFSGFVYIPKLVENGYVRSNRVPVADATVIAMSGSVSGKKVITNQSGQYIFRNVGGDELRLRVEKNGFEPKEVIVYRHRPTTIEGRTSDYHGDPQNTPGNILIGLAWPEEVRTILRQTVVVHDLLYIKRSLGANTGGHYSSSTGIIVMNADGTRGILTFAHEIGHAHQHALTIAAGRNSVLDWEHITSEGKAFIDARMKDWQEVGRADYDTLVTNNENAAETMAYWWITSIGHHWWDAGQNLEVTAPNRFKWAEEWLGN